MDCANLYQVPALRTVRHCPCGIPGPDSSRAKRGQPPGPSTTLRAACGGLRGSRVLAPAGCGPTTRPPPVIDWPSPPSPGGVRRKRCFRRIAWKGITQ